jgi:hypothetical protein
VSEPVYYKTPGATDCTCICHSEAMPVKHVMPCCYPCAHCGKDTHGDQEAHDKEFHAGPRIITG